MIVRDQFDLHSLLMETTPVLQAEEMKVVQRVEDLVKAIRAKDIDGVMSVYAPNIVSFDFGPPLRYAGADHKRRTWQEVFVTFPGPIDYEVRDLNVSTQGELAFVYSVNQLNGARGSGRVSDLWVRWTACFRQINGVWLIVHDHVSFPADIERGQAFLNLIP